MDQIDLVQALREQEPQDRRVMITGSYVDQNGLHYQLVDEVGIELGPDEYMIVRGCLPIRIKQIIC